ncbi:MAG TPA: hypothetical protein VGZ22_31995 [Isosphaeraceae bacterium]|jgi:hypothetical protein|nr:hypothetical protein [Isosphaeraceae bacterium]
MADVMSSDLLAGFVGQVVVLDLQSPYVCLGKLVGCDALYLELTDADLHDFRDSQGTRELYVYDSARFGVRRNRARVMVARSEVVAITRLTDVAES